MAPHMNHKISAKGVVWMIAGILFVFCFLFLYNAIFASKAEDDSLLPETAEMTMPLPTMTPTPIPTPVPGPTLTPSATPSPTPSPSPSPTSTPTPSPIPTSVPTASPVPAPVVLGPCEVVYRGDKTRADIAFTFDDSGDNLAKILEILNRKGIKGTFFLMAGELKKNPELWQQAIKDGHLVCNHTVNHPLNLQDLSDDKIRKEIVGWEDTARAVLGDDYVAEMKSKFPYFRSPGGNKSDKLQRILGELGYTKMIYWSCEDIYFATHNPDHKSMAQHYIDDSKNGSIFLLHPGDWDSVEAIIDGAQAKGFQFKTLPEILENQAPA